jgi:uncharacterized protein (DUF2141 family)
MRVHGLKNKNPFVFWCSAFVVVILLISSCAQIGAPSGGSYDRKPPRVVRYRPDSATLGFKSRSIEITFDEYVQLQELNNQLLISPPLEYTPDITIKKKTLYIVLDKKEVLKPNTTYSISFGNAVKDIRESNALENFRYIFSTGTFIDSLSLGGSVQNAFDHKTEKNLLVMLYSDLSDSAVYKAIPDYFGKTNDVGAFKINNIRQGKYRVVALKDNNSNYKYNDDEAFGFLDSLVDIGPQTKDAFIYLYTEAPKLLFLKKYAQLQYGKIQLVFNQGSDSLRITKLNKEALKDTKELIELSKTKDTLVYWIDPVDKDSLILQVNNGSKILDTVRFKLVKKETALKATSRSPLKLALLNSSNADLFDLNRDLRLIFSHPIEKINNPTTVLLKEDSTDYSKYPLMYEQLPDPQTVVIRTPKKIDAKNSSRNLLLKENTTYSLTIPPATFTDFFGLTNDTIKMKFRTKEEKYYGSVKINLKSEAMNGQYILQLLNEKETVIRQSIISKKEESIFYDFLYPSGYKLKIIFDKNANGKWDTGNFLKKLQPEKVSYNVEAVNIRSNWDLELDWNITEPK